MGPKKFELEIIYGTDQSLAVEEDETILSVKGRALALFGIDGSEIDQYILRAKVRGDTEQLDEAKTVAQSELHNHHKVTLAAGAPFGAS